MRVEICSDSDCSSCYESDFEKSENEAWEPSPKPAHISKRYGNIFRKKIKVEEVKSRKKSIEYQNDESGKESGDSTVSFRGSLLSDEEYVPSPRVGSGLCRQDRKSSAGM